MNKAMERAINRQQEIRDGAAAANRDLNAEETREFNTLQGIIDALTEDDAGGMSRAQDNQEEEEPPNQVARGNEEPQARAAGYNSTDAAEIVAICRHYGADAGEFFARNLTVEQVRREIMDRQMQDNTPVQTRAHVTEDEEDKRRAAVSDGIRLRGGAAIETPAPGANTYRGFTMRDVAVECLEREHTGKDYRHMSPDDIFREASRAFYNPESSFPAILDDVVQKSYVEGLALAGTSFERFVRFGSLPNFKKSNNHEYLISYSGDLEEVPENGELKAYVPEDVRMPLRELKTYGRQFTMTRKAFIDDDIGFITSMPRRFARLSQTTQNKLVYAILLNKQKIFDGKFMFDDSRKNTLKEGSLPTLDVLQQMIYMIGIQKDAAGNQLAITPNAFIVPLGIGVELEKLLATPTIYSAEGTITNPYYGKGYEVIEDVTLNGMVPLGTAVPWFAGVKGEFLQVDYLNGERAATIRRSEQAGTLGFIWDVYHDFGVSALHPEAVCRNPGVAFDDKGIKKS